MSLPSWRFCFGMEPSLVIECRAKPSTWMIFCLISICLQATIYQPGPVQFSTNLNLEAKSKFYHQDQNAIWNNNFFTCFHKLLNNIWDNRDISIKPKHPVFVLRLMEQKLRLFARIERRWNCRLGFQRG